LNAPRKNNFQGILGAESKQGYIVLTDVTTIEVLKNVKFKSIRSMNFHVGMKVGRLH
jgi:hypothetical protein